jgi:tyrosyl-tRNA synthetase
LLLGRESATIALDPREAKRELARELVSWLHDPEQALAAEREFDRVFVEDGAPSEIEELRYTAPEGPLHLPAVIAEAFGLSRGEARRLIDQGAVTLDGEPVTPGTYDIPAERADGQVLRVGKRRFCRLRLA